MSNKKDSSKPETNECDELITKNFREKAGLTDEVVRGWRDQLAEVPIILIKVVPSWWYERLPKDTDKIDSVFDNLRFVMDGKVNISQKHSVLDYLCDHHSYQKGITEYDCVMAYNFLLNRTLYPGPWIKILSKTGSQSSVIFSYIIEYYIDYLVGDKVLFHWFKGVLETRHPSFLLNLLIGIDDPEYMYRMKLGPVKSKKKKCFFTRLLNFLFRRKKEYDELSFVHRVNRSPFSVNGYGAMTKSALKPFPQTNYTWDSLTDTLKQAKRGAGPINEMISHWPKDPPVGSWLEWTPGSKPSFECDKVEPEPIEPEIEKKD